MIRVSLEIAPAASWSVCPSVITLWSDTEEGSVKHGEEKEEGRLKTNSNCAATKRNLAAGRIFIVH